MKINIEKQFNPVFRGKQEDSEQKIETILSNEEDNDNEFGEKKIRLLNKENQDFIGSISFDYISKNDNKFIKVRFAGIGDNYNRKDLSLDLYKHLIDIAKRKELNGICSDEVVQGGALASWKKLQEQGYDLSVFPELFDKYKEFCKTYDEGKYFKDQFATGNGESVFTINL
ncbi:MAG: hypothetical protein WC467_01910 [Patescibacteria group bacterium]